MGNDNWIIRLNALKRLHKTILRYFECGDRVNGPAQAAGRSCTSTHQHRLRRICRQSRRTRIRRSCSDYWHSSSLSPSSPTRLVHLSGPADAAEPIAHHHNPVARAVGAGRAHGEHRVGPWSRRRIETDGLDHVAAASERRLLQLVTEDRPFGVVSHRSASNALSRHRLNSLDFSAQLSAAQTERDVLQGVYEDLIKSFNSLKEEHVRRLSRQLG